MEVGFVFAVECADERYALLMCGIYRKPAGGKRAVAMHEPERCIPQPVPDARVEFWVAVAVRPAAVDRQREIFHYRVVYFDFLRIPRCYYTGMMPMLRKHADIVHYRQRNPVIYRGKTVVEYAG